MRTIRDGLGVLPFSIARSVGTEEAVIASTKDENFTLGSKILSINDFPTAPLSYEEVKNRLASATYPIVLQLQKPLSDALVPSLDAILSLGSQDGDNTVRFNAFKILLSRGIPMIKHNSGNLSQHLTILRISDKEILYRKRLDPRKEVGGNHEQWSRFSLFHIRFVLEGKDSDQVRRKFLNPKHCVEIRTDERGFLFELPLPQKLRKLRREEAEAASKRRAAQLAVSSYSSPSFSASNDNKLSAGKEAAELDDLLEEEKADEVATRTGDSASVSNLTMGSTASLGTEVLHAAKCKLIVDCLRSGQYVSYMILFLNTIFAHRQLVLEIRGSQIFVDKQGMPIRRLGAKVTFRKLEG